MSKEQLWNLDSTIASFVLPRLKAFKQYHQQESKFAGLPINFKGGHLTEEEWMSILDQMIYSFELVVEGELIINQYPAYMNGMILFAQYFNHLWD